MKTRQSRIVGIAAVAWVAIMTGCLDRELRPLNPCLVSGVSRKVQVRNVDKVDLLMMVDNSNSMAGEQVSLKKEFPNVIKVLTTGYRFDGDPDPFPPVKDLHVGIVSSDMGIPGVELPPSCHADGGDDGKLQNAPHGDGCDAQYPLWLNFIGDAKIAALTEPMKFANDVGCIATLGTGGCGFEQQLESPFKALMPKLLTDASGNVVQNPYRFIATDEMRTWGRGDMPVAQGGNKGFIRNQLTEGLSLIAILIVSDEEDCSVKSTEHLKPNNQLPEDSPFRMEDINLRCFNHKELLYDLEQRYLAGFKALRPGNEKLVVFAAIVGVPTDLVDESVLSQVDFEDDAQREQFYANILGDQRMIEEVDPTTMPGSGQGNLRPSCVRPPPPGETMPSTAFPPRRIVELARLFGTNGIVQSICQENFGPAMTAIIDIIAKQLGEVCLPRPLVRQSNGMVPCNVVWELPPQAPPGAPTPIRCDQLSFLGPVDEGRATTNASGGANCKVKQIAVTDFMSNVAPAGDEGWFYDNFTEDLKKTCKPDQQQRVAFTSMAKPPTGVTVKLECLNETQKLANTRLDLAQAVVQPEIGTNCGGEIGTNKPMGDIACVVTLQDNTEDRQMFCHPDLNVCVRGCTSDTQCPPAWVCDDRPETLVATKNHGAYCVNPTCGADTTTK
ncbi:MAG TPA: hypothetical protein VFN67_40570 [Polyangiales bacterium]|nr:hypothetical protein [Polyangiales bacterium]